MVQVPVIRLIRLLLELLNLSIDLGKLLLNELGLLPERGQLLLAQSSRIG